VVLAPGYYIGGTSMRLEVRGAPQSFPFRSFTIACRCRDLPDEYTVMAESAMIPLNWLASTICRIVMTYVALARSVGASRAHY
jgi:hypothetical protein